MSTIHRVESSYDVESFHELLNTYEHSLPLDLRHGSVPDVVELRKEYVERNVAVVARIGERAVGCVAVSKIDDATYMELWLQSEGDRDSCR